MEKFERRKYYQRHKEEIQASNKRSREKRLEQHRLAAKQAYLRRRARINAIKDAPCLDCGKKYPPYVMEFHHRDPSTKEITVAQGLSYYRIDRALKEIDKCDLLCANCHRIREWGENGLRRRAA